MKSGTSPNSIHNAFQIEPTQNIYNRKGDYTFSLPASGNAAPPPSSLPPPSSETSMAMNCIKSLRNVGVTNSGLGSCRTFAVGGKAKKGKGGGASDAPKQSSLSKEVKSTTVVGANILKEGTDPKILADSEYPEWLWHLLDKKPALSELRRKNIETLPYEDLKRFCEA
ncbi:unnamed protein product [Lactuca virosa]|uniref:Large ribosomal subunit protein mL54 n=1 Tax=Lactuca virosa TaxID=75947 RepID=A0AAU9M3E2_9ASTR|nr:unnamed protein product [Lactuca virosa]